MYDAWHIKILVFRKNTFLDLSELVWFVSPLWLFYIVCFSAQRFSTCSGTCEQAVLPVSVWMGMAASAVGGNHLYTLWKHIGIIVTTVLLFNAPSGKSPLLTSQNSSVMVADNNIVVR